MTIPLRRCLTLLVLATGLAGPVRADELASALKTFASWKQGSPVAQLAATRQAVFRDTADPSVRVAHESALLAFLATDADPQAKQRVLGWLGDIAGNASVPVLAKLLDDKALGSAACGALERIPGKAANDALLATLASPRIDVIHSLGRRNDPASEKPLLRILQSASDPGIRKAAMTALASMDSRALRMFKAPADLAADHGLALLQLADRARRDGDLKEARSIYSQIPDVTDTLKRETFLGLLAASGRDHDSVLRIGLADPHLRETAIRQIRAGFGSDTLLSELVGELAEAPDKASPTLVRALAICSGVHTQLLPVLTRMLETPGTSRLVAIDALARAGTGTEAKLLLALVAGGPQVDQAHTAAREALTLMADASVDEALQMAAGDSDPAIATTAIALLGTRPGHAAASGLWAITRGRDATRANAALAALAASLPPGEFPALLDHFLASVGTPAEAPAKTAVWEMLRRLPDQELAITQVENAATKATPAAAATLKQMTERIRANKKPQPKKKTAAKPGIPLPEEDDRTGLQPNGYREVLYHDAGTGILTATTSQLGTYSIKTLAGQKHAFSGIDHPLTNVDFGDSVQYELTGLTPDEDYVLGLAWWDVDSNKRRQEVRIDGALVLPATPPLAYHGDQPTWSRLHLPVPAAAARDGKATLTISKTAGPNAVVSQFWLLQRQPDLPPTKRILIVTGDDFRGHRWRETGPEFAAILRHDPRLEVTISETPHILASPLLGHYDAVFLHFKNYEKRLPTTKALWTNLDRFVRNGGGLVVAHFGCGALQEWNGFVDLSGRIWNPKLRGHDPYGEFLVRILNTSHPATGGLEDFTTEDELYTCLDGDTPVTVLADATSKVDQRKYPMAFTVPGTGQGRVFHCPLGHDRNALQSNGTRQLYQQATAWAAGL